MTTSDFKVDGSAIQTLMVKAIMEAWSPEQRDALISDAVASLLQTVSSTRWGKDKTVLEVALKDGAETAAKIVIAELLQTEFKGTIEKLVRQELISLLEESPDTPSPIRQAIASGLSKHLSVARY